MAARARSGSENVWGKAVHRVVTEGISPEQAVDEAIARIKQILSGVAGAAAGRGRPLPAAFCPLSSDPIP